MKLALLKFYTWFKSQKLEFKIIMFFIVAIIILSMYYNVRIYFLNRELTKNHQAAMKLLEKEIEDLEKDNDAIAYERDQNKKRVIELEDAQFVDKEQSKIYKDEIKNKPIAVRSYADWKLDSILTNYRHISPTKN